MIIGDEGEVAVFEGDALEGRRSPCLRFNS